MVSFAYIRSLLFSLGFRVKNQSLNEIPNIALTDFGLIPLIGWNKAALFFKRFKSFRENLREENWSCLTSLYPRSYYIFYYFLLFWWADYCNVLSEVVASPKGSLVAESFFRYIVEIDRIIDDPKNSNRMLTNPSLLKMHPDIAHWLRTFFSYLGGSIEQIRPRRQICRGFWKYRNRCLVACQDTLVRSCDGLQQILLCKEITVGGLFQTWSSILGELYCPASQVSMVENAGIVLSRACVAMQVHEDILDLPVDMNGAVFNIFHEILKTYPEELEICMSYIDKAPWQHLDDIWAQQNLPNSYREARNLLAHYLGLALEESLIRSKAYELCKLLGNVNSHPIGV